MILITGGAGFIGSALVHELNLLGETDIVVADRFESGAKWKNLRGAKFCNFIYADDLFDWIKTLKTVKPKFIFHLGACSSTTEMDMDFLWENNVQYSKQLFQWASLKNIPMLYASSAATYGDGEQGYSDDHKKIDTLRPLNPYGWSKQVFDQWVLKQNKKTPPFYAGIKFFNVYGPNENHKEDMRSLVNKAFDQIKEKKEVRLFKSHRPDFKDGEQLRDFIYVKDVCRALLLFYQNKKLGASQSGIYNLGTGKAHSFLELVQGVFSALQLPPRIQYIDMPDTIRDQYQYFTEAKMDKFHKVFKNFKFTPLSHAVNDYVCCHLNRKEREGHY